MLTAFCGHCTYLFDFSSDGHTGVCARTTDQIKVSYLPDDIVYTRKVRKQAEKAQYQRCYSGAVKRNEEYPSSPKPCISLPLWSRTLTNFSSTLRRDTILCVCGVVWYGSIAIDITAVTTLMTAGPLYLPYGWHCVYRVCNGLWMSLLSLIVRSIITLISWYLSALVLRMIICYCLHYGFSLSTGMHSWALCDWSILCTTGHLDLHADENRIQICAVVAEILKIECVFVLSCAVADCDWL